MSDVASTNYVSPRSPTLNSFTRELSCRNGPLLSFGGPQTGRSAPDFYRVHRRSGGLLIRASVRRRRESRAHQGPGGGETGRRGAPELRDRPQQSAVDDPMDGGRRTGKEQHVHRDGRPAVRLDNQVERVVRRAGRTAHRGRHVPGRRQQRVRPGHRHAQDRRAT